MKLLTNKLLVFFFFERNNKLLVIIKIIKDEYSLGPLYVIEDYNYLKLNLAGSPQFSNSRCKKGNLNMLDCFFFFVNYVYMVIEFDLTIIIAYVDLKCDMVSFINEEIHVITITSSSKKSLICREYLMEGNPC